MTDLYRSLFDISKIVLSEDRFEQVTQKLLQKVVEITSARRGFIVVREDGSYVEKFQIEFDRSALSEQKRRFSRSLVRRAIASNEMILTSDAAAQWNGLSTESAQIVGASSILVAPLRFGDDVYAVVYLEKPDVTQPFDEGDRNFLSEFADIAGIFIHRALERQNLLDFKKSRESEIQAKYDFREIVARHPKMMQLLELIAQVAESDSTILIHGETGTGKELVARAVYLNSARRNHPFITLYCGALPHDLVEAELFGHKKGAFTGATQDRVGRIAQAHGGTIFIDEVGEIPSPVQAKLLRFLQFGEIQPLGSDQIDRVDVRVIAATHRNLSQMVEQGDFRQDLYYRLKVIDLSVPPLRERRSDIAMLCNHFIAKYWRRKGPPPTLHPRALHALLRYDFPGNVRELAHFIERACLLTREDVITVESLPEEIGAQRDAPTESTGSVTKSAEFVEYTNEELKEARDWATQQAVAEIEKSFLQGLMTRHDGEIRKAAEAAGMQRTYLYKLLKKHGLKGEPIDLG